MTTGYAIHALETVAGTPPASGWREVLIDSDDIKTKMRRIERGGIRRTAGAPTSASVRVVPDGAEGNIPLPVTPNAIGMFLALCASTSVVSTPVGATLARKHLHTWAADGPPVDKTLSTEFYRDRLDGLLDAYTYSLGQATQLEFSLDKEGTLSASVGMTYAEETVITTNEEGLPSRTPTAPVMGFPFAFNEVQATLTPRGGSPADECLTSLSATFPTGIERTTYICTDGQTASSRSGTPAPTGTLEWDYRSPRYAQGFLAGELFKLEILGTLPDLIEGSTYPSILFTIDAIQFTGDDPKLDENGRTTQSLPFAVLDDEGNANPVMTIERITTDTAL